MYKSFPHIADFSESIGPPTTILRGCFSRTMPRLTKVIFVSCFGAAHSTNMLLPLVTILSSLVEASASC